MKFYSINGIHFPLPQPAPPLFITVIMGEKKKKTNCAFVVGFISTDVSSIV